MSPPDVDSLFDVLSDQSRRRILAALLENDRSDALSITDDISTGDPDRTSLNTQMYHRHLPKLDDLGLIEWNRETHEVQAGPHFDEIKPLLTFLATYQAELRTGAE